MRIIIDNCHCASTASCRVDHVVPVDIRTLRGT